MEYLIDAIRSSDVYVCKQLVQHNDVNGRDNYGNAPLIEAVNVGNLTIVNILLAFGADLNIVDHRNMTPLHYAVCLGNLCIVEALINSGAQVDNRDENGNTPLIIAAEYMDFKIVRALLRKGADMFIMNYDFKNALESGSSNKALMYNMLKYLPDESLPINSRNSNISIVARSILHRRKRMRK